MDRLKNIISNSFSQWVKNKALQKAKNKIQNMFLQFDYIWSLLESQDPWRTCCKIFTRASQTKKTPAGNGPGFSMHSTEKALT